MSAPIQVLIVDDDEVVARLHRSFLAGLEGFAVCGVAGTGPDAVAAVRALEPDIVLLDIHLPGFSGIEVLRMVRASRQRQPEIIAVTAARDVDSVREARRAGVRHYLAKPFAANDLRERLTEIRAEGTAATPGSAPDSLDQSQIDALMSTVNGPTRLPKGLSAETLSSVRDAVRDTPRTSATELSDRIGLSRVSVRRYLEYLVECGSAQRSLDYSSAGRPVTRYQLRA